MNIIEVIKKTIIVLGSIIGGILLIWFLIWAGIEIKKHIDFDNAVRDIQIFNGRVSKKEKPERTETYTCGGYYSNKTWHTIHCHRQVYDCKTTIDFGNNFTKQVEYCEGIRIGKPAPAEFEALQIGQAVSIQEEYKNYIKASDTTILKRKAFLQDYKYKDLVIEEPKVYDKIKINQFIQILPSDKAFTPYSSDELKAFNEKLMEINADLGPIRKLNTIIFIVPDFMNDYIYAIDEKWMGSNKNEDVLFINLDNNRNITRVQSLSWSTENGDIEATLDNLGANEVKSLDTKDKMLSFMDKVKEVLSNKFVKKDFREFEYLEQEVKAKFDIK